MLFVFALFVTASADVNLNANLAIKIPDPDLLPPIHDPPLPINHACTGCGTRCRWFGSIFGTCQANGVCSLVSKANCGPQCTGLQHSCPCATGHYCLFAGGMCKSPESPCPSQNHCPTLHCPALFCPKAQQQVKTANGCLVCPVCVGCWSGHPCPVGQQCVDGTCVHTSTSCTDSSHCPYGQQCVNGECSSHSSCATVLCPVNTYCVNGACRPSPTGHCINRPLTLASATNSESLVPHGVDPPDYLSPFCPSGEHCVNGVCQRCPQVDCINPNCPGGHWIPTTMPDGCPGCPRCGGPILLARGQHSDEQP